MAVLLHGSGPQDRDESDGPNRPFRDIALGLATHGVATLRFDKRTKLYPQDFEDRPEQTVKEEVLDDAALAVAFVKGRPEVDPNRIVVVGHSRGAMLARRIAANNKDIVAIVMLAPAARPLPLFTVGQVEYLMSLKTEVGAQQKAALARLRADATRVAAARPGDTGAPFMGVPLDYWADLDVYEATRGPSGWVSPNS